MDGARTLWPLIIGFRKISGYHVCFRVHSSCEDESCVHFNSIRQTFIVKFKDIQESDKLPGNPVASSILVLMLHVAPILFGTSTSMFDAIGLENHNTFLEKPRRAV